MKSKSKKDGKIFTGKFARLAITLGLADPVEGAKEKPAVKKTVRRKPARRAAKKKV